MEEKQKQVWIYVSFYKWQLVSVLVLLMCKHVVNYLFIKPTANTM